MTRGAIAGGWEPARSSRRSRPSRGRLRRPPGRPGPPGWAGDLAIAAAVVVMLAWAAARHAESWVTDLAHGHAAWVLFMVVTGVALLLSAVALLTRRLVGRWPSLALRLHRSREGAGAGVAPASGGGSGRSRGRSPGGRGGARAGAGAGAASSGWATRRDLAPLLVREATGDRVVLGLTGRRVVAAERLQSVLVVGPSQSGKTTGLAIPALADWQGPVLATSVKTDLVRETMAARSARGEVAVFDPTSVSGLETRSWSPLSEAMTWAGARRAADSLCSVGRKASGIEDASYWHAAAERLLAPLLRAAAVVNGSMADVVRWLDEEAVNEPILALELAEERDAARVAKSCASMEERQRSSVYSTAQTILAAYGDPDVVASERRGSPISPGWLLGGGERPRTLYCCAPARDQARLSPVFVALIRQVVDTAFDTAARDGRPLDPPLLLVLDEAANIAPIGDMDQILATAAGHGVSLVTVWQDLAQIEARYGERWATIVNNHRAKAICPGVADPRTLELLSSLIGDIEVAQRSTSRAGDGSWSESESAWRVPIAPAGWIRRMPPRHVLVVYGGMPPALVRMRGPAAVAQTGAPGAVKGQPTSRSATRARSSSSGSRW